MYHIKVVDNGNEHIMLIPNHEQIHTIIGDRLTQKLSKTISQGLTIHTIQDVIKHYNTMFTALLMVRDDLDLDFPNGIVLTSYNAELSYTITKINSFTIKAE